MMLSPKTKEKLAYWAKKLECPVDDNANYENTYVCLLHPNLTVRELIRHSGAIEI
jgi:hypothetical protein